MIYFLYRITNFNFIPTDFIGVYKKIAKHFFMLCDLYLFVQIVIKTVVSVRLRSVIVGVVTKVLTYFTP